MCFKRVALSKEVLLLSGLGIYSGIFAMYLQCPSKDSMTANIVFYVLCLLYALSTASVLSDLIAIILEVSKTILSSVRLYRYHAET